MTATHKEKPTLAVVNDTSALPADPWPEMTEAKAKLVEAEQRVKDLAGC